MSKPCCGFTKCRQCSAPAPSTSPLPDFSAVGGKLRLSPAAATCLGGTRRGRAAARAPSLLSALLSRSRPGAQRSSPPGVRPAWPAPKRRCLPERPRPPASRGGAGSPHPSPGAVRAASGAHARPPPLPAGGAAPPAAPPSRGGSRRGSGRRAADLLRQRAAPLSSRGGSSSAARRRASPFPRHRPPQPGSRAPRRACRQHGSLPGARARVRSLPAGGRRIRREVSWPRGDLPSASFSTLIPSGPAVPSPGAVARSRRRLSVQKLGHRIPSAGREPSSRSLHPEGSSRAYRLGDPGWGGREARARHLASEGAPPPRRGGDARDIPWSGVSGSCFRRLFGGETSRGPGPNPGLERSGPLTSRLAAREPLRFQGGPVCLPTWVSRAQNKD